MATTEIPIPPSRDVPATADTLCFMAALSFHAGHGDAAEGYLLEVLSILSSVLQAPVTP